MVINSTIFNTHHKTSLLSPKLLLEVVQESELDGLNFPTALVKLEPTPPSHSRMTCPTPSSPPAIAEELALNTTDGTISNTLHFQLMEIMSLSHSSPSLNSRKRNPTSGSNSQPASVSKTRSTSPRTLVTLLLPPAKRTQPILQTQKLTKPKLLLIALPQKLSEIKKSHIDRGKKSLLKLKSNIIQIRKGSPYPFS